MNGFNSVFDYHQRWLTPILQEATQFHPVLVLTGARQVGKSTLLRYAEPFKHWRYLTLDNYDVLQQSQRDPDALWAGATHIVIDEAQKSPALLSAIKRAIDQDQRQRLRFVVSGSANLLLMKTVSESLAGRAIYFTLHPMSVGEVLNMPPPTLLSQLLSGSLPAEATMTAPDGVPRDKQSLLTYLLRGFMPPLLSLTSPNAWVQWWEGYIATYLERDLRQFAQIDALIDFRRVMQLASLRTCQLLNQTELARDARISQATVHRYLNLLETTHLAQRLRVYIASHSTRQMKTPKWAWMDAALAIFLAGYYDLDALSKARELGAFFETLIYHHLSVLAQLLTPRPNLFYWRTQRGDEVDFVLEHGRHTLAFEVKLSDRVNYADTAHLNTFLVDHPKTQAAVLLYTGDQIQRLGEKVIALPWWLLAA
jgi:hypothetical protein